MRVMMRVVAFTLICLLLQIVAGHVLGNINSSFEVSQTSKFYFAGTSGSLHLCDFRTSKFTKLESPILLTKYNNDDFGLSNPIKFTEDKRFNKDYLRNISYPINYAKNVFRNKYSYDIEYAQEEDAGLYACAFQLSIYNPHNETNIIQKINILQLRSLVIQPWRTKLYSV